MPFVEQGAEEKIFNVNHNGIKFNASNQIPLLGQFKEQKLMSVMAVVWEFAINASVLRKRYR